MKRYTCPNQRASQYRVKNRIVYRLLKSNHGLKQSSKSQNIKYNETIKSYGFHQSLDEACVYKLNRDKFVIFLILYVDDISLYGRNVKLLTEIKYWLTIQFKMKDLGNTNYVLGIQILRDRNNKMLPLSQAAYIDKVPKRFSMQNSKKGLMPTRYGIVLSKKQCPTTP